ncbi:MAG: hypothetical protein IJ848_02750, partial [Alphaproteobacteria bacterium]|nr:hypothetical protein [Alphaproteobacteria bacterium]
SNILNEDAILCEKHKNELLKFADWSYTALLNSNQAEVVRDSLITPYNKEEVIQRYRNYLNKKCNNSKFNYLLDQKSELYKIINDILIINIYQYYHCWNNFGILKNNMKFLSENNNPYYGMYDSLNDGFEIYQNDVIYNILYELTDYDKKELLTFKDLTYEILSKSESKDIIITKFCSNTSDFDIIKEYFTIIAGSKLGNKLQETLKKYKLKNYIIDILNFNIYKFMCQYYISNNDKINEIKYNVNIPNNRAQQWEMLYTIMSNDNLETNKDCPLEMQKWIQCVLKEDYFGMVNAEFNCVKNVMNDDQKQRIAYDYITNPKIIEYIKPMIIKQYIEKNN